jgi:hypothetical protein
VSTLTLTVADPSSAPQAEVRDWDLKLVGHVTPGNPRELAPGRYLVSLANPGGEEEVKAVEIEPGADATVEFGELPVASDAALESLSFAPAPPRARPRAGLPWHARLLSGRDGAPVSGFVSAADADDAVELSVVAQAPPGPLWVQVAVPRGVPRNVMLPDRWRLRLRPGHEDVWATAVPPREGFVEALAVYLGSGQLREAADLGVQAMELLRDKIGDPIGATVGGYALLRMARTELMHDWPYNLSSLFGWLPDGAVIAAELALLQDDKPQAAVQLERAAERGVPFFADGLSLLGRRVREGLVETEPAVRLAGLTPFMELGQLTVAIPGRDPHDPAATQEPLASFPDQDGWRSFVGAREA